LILRAASLKPHTLNDITNKQKSFEKFIGKMQILDKTLFGLMMRSFGKTKKAGVYPTLEIHRGLYRIAN